MRAPLSKCVITGSPTSIQFLWHFDWRQLKAQTALHNHAIDHSRHLGAHFFYYPLK